MKVTIRTAAIAMDKQTIGTMIPTAIATPLSDVGESCTALCVYVTMAS